MRLTRGFIKSRLGRKMLTAFVLAALLPLAALGTFSYYTARGQVEDFARDRLRETTKMVAMSIFDRLTFAESELRAIAEGYERTGRIDALPSTIQRLEQIWIERRGHAGTAPVELPLPDEGLEFHVSQGRGVIDFAEFPEGLRAVVTVPVGGSRTTWIRGAIDPDYAWGESALAGLPEATELVAVVDGSVLLSSSPLLREAVISGALPEASGGSDVLDLTLGSQPHFAHSWTLPLGWALGHEGVRFVATEPASEAMLAASGLGREALLAVLSTLWVILLVSLVRIRRQLEPLDKLRNATEALAARDFRHRVDVDSNDELAELGASFNQMSDLLATHFEHLTSTVELDRAILSGVDVTTIAANALRTVEQTYDLHGAALLLLPESGARATVHWRTAGEMPTREESIRIYDAERAWLEDLSESAAPCKPHTTRWIAPSLAANPSLAAVPVYLEDGLGAVLVVARQEPFNGDQLDLLTAVGNQLGVALTKVRLFTDLEEMKTGALTAFARAVDAKSKWTSGHSERVTEVAVRIGEKMGFGPERLELLQRGGLLHDIGKIGVPAEILDKPGKLTAEEFEAIKLHPQIGATILEPVTSYRDIIPMVLQHHEKWNGTGYPAGLAGEEIALEARVMAVADVYDALTSTRPYRDGMDVEQAVAIILKDSGTHFDPQVIRAFRRLIPELRESAREAA